MNRIRIFLTTFCPLLFMTPLPAPSAAEPRALPIANAGFESPALSDSDRTPSIDGWLKAPGDRASSGLIRDGAQGINQAKEGRQWLYLNRGGSVGQCIGPADSPLFTGGSRDRLFVGFTLSSIQNDEPNDVDLTVALYIADSAKTWEGGTRVSSRRLRDLTNDNRSDLNSYIDGYAVLMLGDEKIRKAGARYWIVLRNNLVDAPGTGMLTLDDVKVNVASPPPPRNGPPNILIVFQDDMGYGDASFMNPRSKIRTPNLDRLAAEGIRFLDAHAAATICGPSRIGLLTGTMPDKLGVQGNFALNGNERFGPPTLPAGTPTLATICRSAGYDTSVVGKWGIPSNWDARLRDGVSERLSEENAGTIVDFSKPLENADAFGFAHRYIFDEHRPFVPGETEPFEGNPRPFGWHENGFAVRDVLTHSQEKLHEYYLRAITDRAVRYIQTKAGLRAARENNFRIAGGASAPFYLHYLTHAPHLPLMPAAQFVGSSRAGLYGDFVVDLDYCLGRLMGVLEETGLARNTLLIFSSDNGPEFTAYQRAKDEDHFSMGPLRGIKRDLYEGGHRVPLVVRWPAVIQAGRVSRALVSLADWYATVAAITGQRPADTTGLDSMNILPLLTGKAKEVRGLMLQDTAVNANIRGIRVGPWMYIDAESGEVNKNREPEWFRRLRNVQDVAGNELYNLATDLGQGRNRGVTNADIKVRLKRLFDKLWTPGTRSTPPFSSQGDSDRDGYSDFFEDVHGFNKGDPSDGIKMDNAGKER